MLRQQFMNQAGPLDWQPRHHVLEIGVWVVAIGPGTLNQAHRSGALARPKLASEQPVVAADGNRPDLVRDVIVVQGQLPVTHEPSQRLPTPQAVVQGFGGGGAIRYRLPGQQQARVQRIDSVLSAPDARVDARRRCMP